MDIETGEFVQVLNVAASHWILISTINCPPGVVNVYDSGGRYTTSRNKKEIAALLQTGKDTITLHYMNVQHQVGVSDCGLFALAFATSLCHAIDPTENDCMECKFNLPSPSSCSRNGCMVLLLEQGRAAFWEADVVLPGEGRG